MTQENEKPKTTLVDGSPVTPEHREIDKRTGMQKAYVVLSAEERAKGFVRPVRTKYKHVGMPTPSNLLRDLTPAEIERWVHAGYVKFEQYHPGNDEHAVGRFYTQEQLDKIGKGCGVSTTMAMPLAETYAREPKFYGGTFCCGCGTHHPVEEFVWDGTDERVGS